MKLMKNILSLNRPLLKAALFSTFALTCVTAFAADPTLVFTELPGDVLQASIAGGPASFGTVKLISGGAIQTWVWTPPAGDTLSVVGTLPAWWIEPDSLPGTPTTYNEIDAVPTSTGVLILGIRSDITGATGNNIFNDEATVPNLIALSNLTGGRAELGVQFDDEGDVRSSTVPDGSSTLTLLGGVLTLVGAVGRKLGK